ncbi:MAG: hypothetical protein IGS39_01780 [Calothrix sp. C42_A2020_038]|nr:hypothetical protein [Calothrix sp. C42_A2020_038]
MTIQAFTCPTARYRGVKDQISQEFNVLLQSFAHRVSILSGLHTGGKLPTHDTYRQLLTLWEELQPYLSLIADGDHADPNPMLHHSTLNALLTMDYLPNSALPSTLDAN